jgi:hypothetical protein
MIIQSTDKKEVLPFVVQHPRAGDSLSIHVIDPENPSGDYLYFAWLRDDKLTGFDIRRAQRKAQVELARRRVFNEKFQTAVKSFVPPFMKTPVSFRRIRRAANA